MELNSSSIDQFYLSRGNPKHQKRDGNYNIILSREIIKSDKSRVFQLLKVTIDGWWFKLIKSYYIINIIGLSENAKQYRYHFRTGVVLTMKENMRQASHITQIQQEVT